ncbi:MAG: MlaD family protein, partial [Cyanobium sp.]
RSSLAFTISGLFLLGGLLFLYGRQYGWFERSLAIRLVVPSSQGLRIGTPVQLSGLRIGVLDRIRLLPDGTVELKLRVPERYRPWLSPRSTALIGRDGLLGDGLIELTAAPMPGTPLPSSFELTARTTPGVDSLLTGLEATRGDLQRLLVSSTRVTDREVPSTLAQLRSSLASGTSVSSTINRELPPTAAQLRETLAAVQGTAAAAEGTAESVGRTVQDVNPELRQALSEFAKAMRRTNGLLERFSVLFEPAPPRVDPPAPQPSVASPTAPPRPANR